MGISTGCGARACSTSTIATCSWIALRRELNCSQHLAPHPAAATLLCAYPRMGRWRRWLCSGRENEDYAVVQSFVPPSSGMFVWYGQIFILGTFRTRGTKAMIMQERQFWQRLAKAGVLAPQMDLLARDAIQCKALRSAWTQTTRLGIWRRRAVAHVISWVC
ncbi:hypothetical protein EDB89DRAFT_548660 [Lactarius sanguifluus]|nr:hypothetical protein EDB89DRAFT_548660 [Lactarius sanguifluus]